MLPGDQFATSASNQALRDDKGALRLDANTNWGSDLRLLLSRRLFAEQSLSRRPGRSQRPRLQRAISGRAQLFSLGDIKTLNAPRQSTNSTSVSCAPSTISANRKADSASASRRKVSSRLGHAHHRCSRPQNEGVENLVFNNFSTGTNTNELKQANNTFQGSTISRR
jgi:hypothetical protein